MAGRRDSTLSKSKAQHWSTPVSKANRNRSRPLMSVAHKDSKLAKKKRTTKLIKCLFMVLIMLKLKIINELQNNNNNNNPPLE